MRTLLKQHPDDADAQRGLAAALSDLGEVYSQRQALAQARKQLEQARVLLEKLSDGPESDIIDWQNLFGLYLSLSLLEWDAGQQKQSRQWLKKCEAVLKHVDANRASFQDPTLGDWLRDSRLQLDALKE